MQESAAYSAPSKWLHWIIAALVAGLIPAGIIMIRLPEGALQNRLFDLHRATGIVVLALVIARLGARRYFGVPEPAATLTPFERIASAAAHHSLLALLLLMPLTGWASMSAYRAEVPVFGLFNLPHILPQSDAGYTILSWLHTLMGFLMAFVIAAHIGGALMHGLIKRDGVLNRMLPETLAQRLDQLLGRAKKSA